MANTENDAAAARRQALADALQKGEPVEVTPSGQVSTPEEVAGSGDPSIDVPNGKLA